MKWPPMVLYMKIRSERTNFGLWLPLFLLGPLCLIFLLVIAAIVLPFLLLALLVSGLAVVFEWETEWLKATLRYLRWVVYGFRGIPALVRVLCNLPGLKIDVAGRREQVFITFH